MIVVNQIQAMEIDGNMTEFDDRPIIEVRSHANSNYLIVLRVGEQDIAVPGQEVLKAVNNALNK